MKRRLALALTASAAAVPRVAPAQEPVRLRAGGASNDVIKPLYYAARSGIFAKLGLVVDLVPMNNGAASAAALVGGDLDLASTSILTPLQGHEKGIPMRILAPSLWNTSEHPNVLTVVLKGSPLRSGRDLDGKTIGVPGLNDLATVGLFSWIDRSGGDAKSVRVIETPAAAAVAFLEQGRADAVTMLEPFVSAALATGKVRVLTQPMDAVAKRFEGAAYIVMEPVVQKKFDAMARLARGIHEAIVYTNAHLPQTVDLVASYSGIAPDVIAKMNRVSDPEYVDARNIQPIIDVLARYHAIDHPFPASEIISSAALKPPG